MVLSLIPGDLSKFSILSATIDWKICARLFCVLALCVHSACTARTRRRCNVGAESGRWARPYSTLLSRRPFSGTLSGLLSLTLLPLPRRLIVLQFPPLNRYDCLAINPYPYPIFLPILSLCASLFPRSARISVFHYHFSTYSYKRYQKYQFFFNTSQSSFFSQNILFLLKLIQLFFK